MPIRPAIFSLSLICCAPLWSVPLAVYAQDAHTSAPAQASPTARLNHLAARYHETKMRYDPLIASFLGDTRYNDQISMRIEPKVRERHRQQLQSMQQELQTIARAKLSAPDQLNLDCLAFEIDSQLALEGFPTHLLPMNQMNSLPVILAQLGSGQGTQPFASVSDYQAYLKRLSALPRWLDVAMANMRHGMQTGVVLPRPLVQALLPQIQTLAQASTEKSPYYLPINKLPTSFSAAERTRLQQSYQKTITRQILPGLRQLAAFLQNDYLPATRDSAGIGSLPNGAAWYRANIRNETSTGLSADEIHALGLAEVERITGEFAKLGQQLGYSGAPTGLLAWLAAQEKYRPYTTEAQVLDGYARLNRQIETKLPDLFGKRPQAALEIRAEPELTRATASDHYQTGSLDGKRPGTFWAVIDQPAQYASTKMTALFLHEGQPGHHFQLSLQQQLSTPKFRKFAIINAYVEGWALYAETLGQEMGLYDDPNAKAGFLSLDMQRAARLVVDTGLHAKGWSRDQTIAWLVEHTGVTQDAARNATERYMAWPGQALGYKIGALKILQLRHKAEQQLGAKFNLARFHDAVLADGSLPLDVLERQMNGWLAQQEH
jgi:uncharacterized protein (DUF885 family)